MNRTLRSTWILVLVLACLVSARADAVDDFVQAEMAKRRIPGLSVAVLRDGKLVRASSYGLSNLETRTPASDSTVYEIGSISKQFAAEAVMLLVEDGKLNLDDSISRHLPANTPEAWKTITVRNLLNHTSGLKDWTEVKEFSYRREYTAEEFIELTRSFPLQFQPGESWLYSNTNLPLIGIIVEHVSGRSFEDFVADRILKRLNLPSIRFKHQEEVVANRASGYVLKNDALANGEPFRPKVIAASGGVLANAGDLARWWEAALTGRVVSPTSLSEMLAPARMKNGRTAAHGFAFFTDVFDGHKVVQHFGSTVGGFGSIVRYFPRERVTVSVIGNLGDGGFGAEYIAKRISGSYVPGSSIHTLAERVDSFPNQTQTHLEILREIAAGKSPAALAAAYVPKVSGPFREQLRTNVALMRSFKSLGSEKFTPDHFMLDPTADQVFRYKMVLSGKTVYYHLRFDKDGKISWISVEE